MDKSMSFNSVLWLKQELDKTISDARNLLDFYIEDSDDLSSAKKAREGFQQISAVLQVADIKGGVFLLEELLIVLDKLIDGEVRRRHEALDAILRATVQLPDYLEYIQSGHEDVPIVLLPLLNDLRAVRDEALLSDKVLFVPGLGKDLALYSSWKSSNENLASLTKALRPVLERALLGIFIRKDVYNNLLMAGAVFLRLGKASSYPQSKRLWWFAQAMAEALHARSLDISIAIKFLFGRLDRQLKNLEQYGEEVFVAQIPPELVKNILFYIASSSSGNTTVDKIKSIYKLDEMIPTNSSVDAARANLKGSNVQIYESLGEAVLEDVDEIKERLEVYSFADNPDIEMLRAVVPKMINLSETLAMLGQKKEMHALKRQVKNLEETLNETEVLTRNELQDIANVLVDIEIGVKNYVQFQGADEAEDEGNLPGHEYNKVFHVVIQETLSDMGKVRGKVNDYLAHHMNADVLENHSALLISIYGAMEVLCIDEVLPLINKLIEFVSAMEESSFEPDESDLANFADGYVSVELYLESLRPRFDGQLEILHRGTLSLKKISLPEKAIVIEEQTPEVTVVENNTLDDDAIESVAKLEKESPDIAAEVAEGIALEILDESSSNESAATISETEELDSGPPLELEDLTPEGSGDEMSGLQEVEGIVEVPNEVPDIVEQGNLLDGLQVLPTDIDPEILEIFLEEINEEAESIKTNLSSWITDHNDEEALSTLRRSFHTLKGSGRLVGAEVLGEFSWSLEDLTNRLINGSIESSMDVISTLEAASKILPELVKGVTERTLPSVEASKIMLRAGCISEGRSPGDSVESSAGKAAVPLADKAKKKVAEEKIPESGSNSSQDLNSVYYDEAETHLEYIQELVEKGREYGTLIKPDEPLRNAIHILNTGAIAAGLIEISEPFSIVEKYLEVCHRVDLPVDDEFLHHLDFLKNFTRNSFALAREKKKIQPIDSVEEKQLQTLLSRAEKLEKEINDESADSEDDIEIEVIELSGATRPEELSIDEIARSLDVSVADGVGNGVGDGDGSDSPESESLEGDDAETEKAEKEKADKDEKLPDKKLSLSDSLPEGVDDELLEIFLEEAYEILDASDASLRQWVIDSNDMVQVNELLRQLHTLKGGARMAGIEPIGDLSHSLETLFTALVEGNVNGGDALVDIVQNSFDNLVKMVDAVRKDQKLLSAKEAIRQIETILNGESLETTENIQEKKSETVEADKIDSKKTSDAQVVQKAIKSAKPQNVTPFKQAADERNKKANAPRELVRVNSDLLDDLVNHAGEVNVFHSRIDETLSHTSGSLKELQETTQRLAEQLRRLETEAEAQMLSTLNRSKTYDADIEIATESYSESDSEHFDPLELDRYSKIQQYSKGLAESLSDLNNLEEMVVENIKEVKTLMTQKSRVSTELQEGLMRTRLVPFSNQVPRLSRIVRQTAKQLGKEVELIIRGEDSELDRKLLESMIAPMEHLLRNAISHGIETPAERKACGKTEKGHIEINIHRSGPEIQIEVSDDGAGINVEKIRDRAIEQNLISEDADLSKDELLHFIIESGFTTTDNINQISGRGVGMDVVNTEIKKLNGALRILSDLGKGTTFIVNLPFTLAINQSLLVQVGEDLFAVPATNIYAVARLKTAKIAQQLESEHPVIDYDGGEYQLRHLASMLYRKSMLMNVGEDQLPLLLVNSGDHQVAFLVDEIFGNREIVVKPLGPPLNQLDYYSGATILGDGKVALILDMPGLIRTTAFGKLKSLIQVEEKAEKKPLIMVVDDSITIRKVTTRILERNNFDVITAKDGMDAAQQLQEITPDLMLLDVEMPRMDGFELATQIRASALHRDLPIIIITSRTGEKHKKRANEIGVNRYLGKPFQEESLLQEINELLEETAEMEISNAG